MRKLIKPTQERPREKAAALLSEALGKVKLEYKGLGTDITHGVTFYKPILTLLAETLGTRRQDQVYCAFPLAGCPFVYYSECLPERYAWVLTDRVRAKGVAVLHELLDLFQSHGRWQLRELIEFVRAVELVVGKKPGLMETLQAAADGARALHDVEGMREPEVGMTEGIVIPVDGIGRVN